MSSSAINAQLFQAKIGNVQNQADTSAVYSAGVWSFKNSTALTSVTITDAGNVGIGTSSPTFNFGKGAMVNNAGAATLRLNNSTASVNAEISAYDASYGLLQYTLSNHPIVWGTNGVERMRITTSGDVQIASRCNIGTAGIVYTGVSGTNAIAFKWTSPNVIARIDNSVDVTLANVSDYRIKRNIDTMQASALERVAQLRPVTYQIADYGTLFKASEEIKEGFIAHELQAVIPSAVEGEKDAEGQIQSLKLDALCAVMVKAIQELSAKVDAQAEEIKALKAQP